MFCSKHCRDIDCPDWGFWWLHSVRSDECWDSTWKQTKTTSIHICFQLVVQPSSYHSTLYILSNWQRRYIKNEEVTGKIGPVDLCNFLLCIFILGGRGFWKSVKITFLDFCLSKDFCAHFKFFSFCHYFVILSRYKRRNYWITTDADI
jgi:hypothetical protein